VSALSKPNSPSLEPLPVRWGVFREQNLLTIADGRPVHHTRLPKQYDGQLQLEPSRFPRLERRRSLSRERGLAADGDRRHGRTRWRPIKMLGR